MKNRMYVIKHGAEYVSNAKFNKFLRCVVATYTDDKGKAARFTAIAANMFLERYAKDCYYEKAIATKENKGQEVDSNMLTSINNTL